ncbi:hypothetical protein [Thermococcus aciditolerans]|uniref:Uncharacterized protein n=1 Tax=Thermococcus aciditolerans TaxID=2598455 RepID=A0A5C0SK94_9EURY|nr:hypothetical protein [Thermococcus aciditolerans]QEK14751.1 hypothetical protein FPV09_06185 [Thermococcus aciditolerans]
MAAPAVVMAYKERDNILQLAMYAFLAIAVLYTLYKLFGMFKEVGEKVEEAKEKVENFMNDLKNDLKQAPDKFKQTGEDILTVITKPGTPEGNAAKTRVQYGGAEWGPGTGGKVDRKTGTIRKYGTPVRPGQEVLFDGEWYTNKFVNNLVKSPDSNEYIPKEDALARKYGFSTYAQFNAWLAGVKAALKAAGKDPSQMSLDQIVRYGRELEKKKEEWRKSNPHKATPRLEPRRDIKRPGLKPLPIEKQNELLKKVYPRSPGGGIVIGYTPVPGLKPGVKPKPPISHKPLPKEPVYRILPYNPPVFVR